MGLGLSHLLVPVLAAFREAHPEVVVRYLTGDRLFRLEYGEAHVAVRAGSVPDQPDNVVQPFLIQRVALYASEAYIARHGDPGDCSDLTGHVFVGADDPKEFSGTLVQLDGKKLATGRDFGQDGQLKTDETIDPNSQRLED